jgi:hypothetical protein
MKRLFTFVITMLLGASLAFAVPQATGGSTGQTDTTNSDTGKKAHKGGKKGHKGGKKSKKGDKGGDTTAPPK